MTRVRLSQESKQHLNVHFSARDNKQLMPDKEERWENVHGMKLLQQFLRPSNLSSLSGVAFLQVADMTNVSS